MLDGVVFEFSLFLSIFLCTNLRIDDVLSSCDYCLSHGVFQVMQPDERDKVCCPACHVRHEESENLPRRN